jgi:hypothetical protein
VKRGFRTVVFGGATLLTGVVASLAVGAAVAIREPAAPQRLPSWVDECHDAGLSGRILFGGPLRTQDPLAGFGALADDGRTVVITLRDGYRATALVVNALTDSYLYPGFYAGPALHHRYELPAGARITDWFLCGSS